MIRLAGRGLVEACWQDEPRPGRPRRQLYRLTADGLTVAVDMLVAVAEAVAEGLIVSAMGGLGVRGTRCRVTTGEAIPRHRPDHVVPAS